jgi:hypothetical protein
VIRPERRRIRDLQVVDVEDLVAIVGREAQAQDRLAAEADEPPRDQRARHRDHLDRQRKAAEDRDQLGVVDDADETAAGRGDDLFPGQRAASALDQGQVAGSLVSAVHVERRSPASFRATSMPANAGVSCSPRRGNRTGDAVAAAKRRDEMIDGGSGTHPDGHPVFEVFERRDCGGFLLRVCVHVLAPEKTVPACAGTVSSLGEPAVGRLSISQPPIHQAKGLLLLRSLFLCLLLGRHDGSPCQC